MKPRHPRNLPLAIDKAKRYLRDHDCNDEIFVVREFCQYDPKQAPHHWLASSNDLINNGVGDDDIVAMITIYDGHPYVERF